MSYLMVDEFNDSTPLDTTFRIQHKGIKLGYVRAHCYKRGVITGNFTCTIKQAGITLGSTIVTSTQINDIGSTYAHGMFTWTFDQPIQLNVNEELTEAEYEIEFTSSGYTGDTANNFNLCKDFDNVFVSEYGINYSVITPEQRATSRPYGLELYKWDN